MVNTREMKCLMAYIFIYIEYIYNLSADNIYNTLCILTVDFVNKDKNNWAFFAGINIKSINFPTLKHAYIYTNSKLIAFVV